MTRRSPGNWDTKREEPCLNIESLSLREAMRQARERTNRERNRAKCRKYYRKNVEKNKLDTVGKDDPKVG